MEGEKNLMNHEINNFERQVDQIIHDWIDHQMKCVDTKKQLMEMAKAALKGIMKVEEIEKKEFGDKDFKEFDGFADIALEHKKKLKDNRIIEINRIG